MSKENRRSCRQSTSSVDRLPIPGQQLIEPVDGVIVDAGQHVGEPGLRIDVVELRRHDQRGHDSGAVGAAFGAGEQSKAKSGEGQVVLLSGEPGIGKSRLTAALMERVAPEPQARLRYFCSPQHTDSALFPIISQMERAAGFTHVDTAAIKLDKLDALLARSF